MGKNRRYPRKDCFEIELVLQSFETKISMNMKTEFLAGSGSGIQCLKQEIEMVRVCDPSFCSS